MENNDDKTGLNVPETLKRLFTAGVSAAFVTEETIRSFVGDLKLPKETLNLLVQGANKSKEDLMNRVSGEVTKLISKTDFTKVFISVLESHRIKVSAEFEFIPKAKPSGVSSEATAKPEVELNPDDDEAV